MPPSSFKIQFADFLIIGSGIAGLRASLELASAGTVFIINKDSGRESNSAYAQGGIAAAINPLDTPKSHIEDTLKAGKGLCNRSSVKILVEEGVQRVRELIDWKTHFDRKGNKLLFTQEAAHSKKRILRAKGDATGDEIIKSLLLKVASNPNIEILENHFTLDLYLENGVCKGAWVLFDGFPKIILSKSVILATGGAGQIYLRTTNPLIATGDGIAMAYRQGAVLEDMEFVQFHPTALCLPHVPPFLLSEAMRGEGGLLKNLHGEAFMKRYHPEAELAPRDLVSRAIWTEMEKTGSGCVYLDMTATQPSLLRKRFPTIYKTCLSYGIDITRDLIPACPSAHFMMGGVQTDLNGMTGIKGLYVAGEAACSEVHGANRLASNSLLEGLVFGARAGRHALAFSGKNKFVTFDRNNIDRQFKRFVKKPPLTGRELDRMVLACKKIMWELVGIIRNEKGLKEACYQLKKLNDSLKNSFLNRKAMETKNMLTIALLISKAALSRKESLGAHSRTDYPHSPSQQKQHSYSQI
ncbi:MAG: L-aspartate oxidase [Nitrospirae bacterium]|nr:L-aspartate oxidase [Nitrospirota bacterium]